MVPTSGLIDLAKESLPTSDFLVIGAGLPRTGTASLRVALAILLKGKIYHMYQVFETGPGPEAQFWAEALQKPKTNQEWIEFLEKRGFCGGLDHPFCIFYK